MHRQRRRSRDELQEAAALLDGEAGHALEQRDEGRRTRFCVSWHRRCSAVAQLRFNSSGDALLIRFDSDSSITESGFLLGWTPLTPPAGLCALDCTEEKRHNEACDLACMNEQCEWDSGGCGEAHRTD